MRLDRRYLVRCLLVGLAGAAAGRAHAGRLKAAHGSKIKPNKFPPLELQASTSALQQLTSGISGWRVERMGKRTPGVWLRTSEGQTWLVGVDQRDLQHMFEVFTLSISSMSELQEQWERWTPPTLPEGVPEGLRKLMTTRPAAPVAPTEFEPWPLRTWRTEVVRRAEFVTEGEAAGRTFGNNLALQTASRPGAVPHSATASCEVAAGVLLTSEGQRLLLAVDWTPMNMLVVQDGAEIEEFIANCELVSMTDYLRNRAA